MALQPVVGHTVAQRYAADVVAPPYDVLTAGERRELAAASPDSFLRVLPHGRPTPAGLDGNRSALERLLTTDRFVARGEPFLGVLRMEHADGTTTALLGDVEVAAYADGRVLPHEKVRDDRVAQLTAHLDVVGVASSPVCVVHRPVPGLHELSLQATRGEPAVRFDAADGVQLELHLVGDAGLQRSLADAVDAAGTLYIADGHHRAAAVARHTPGGRVLSAVVPSDQLRVLAFHRRIDGLAAVTAADVAEAVRSLGMPCTSLNGPAAPTEPGVVHLTAQQQWLAVDLRTRRLGGPVESLDVRLVERELLGPLCGLGVADAVHVVPVPGPAGLGALQAPDSVGLALHPPRIDDVLAVADAGLVMPPKSTYLAPKLRSGLLVVER